jgi:hypothetical protein
LLEVAATTTDTGRGYRPYAGEPTASPPSLQEEQECERQYHNALVNDGGRPCYPIALLEEFSEDPDKYPGLLQPWERYGWEVFREQLLHWHRFLQWQLLNRGSYDSDTEYARYVSEAKLEGFFIEDSDGEELKDDALFLMESWKRTEARYRQDWRHLSKGDNLPIRPEGQPFFPTYVEVVKCRLAQHGVTRTIQLKKDVKQQDKLSTWIEYLAYQYAWCDRYTRQIKSRKHKFDEEWERLVASGVLHDWETAEYLHTTASGFERQGEFDTAYKVVLDAKKAVEALLAEIERSKQGPGCSRLQELERSLAEAKSKESSARQAYQIVKARLDHIRSFIYKAKPYRITQDNIRQHGKLAQWILDQLPVVEAELSEDGNLESGPSSFQPAAQEKPSPQPAHDAAHKTRCGRVTKKIAQRRADARRRRSESAQSGASPPPAPWSRRLDPDSNAGVGSAVQPRKRQRKVYE